MTFFRMTTVSLKLPATLLHEIEREAATRGVPKSAVIRDSLARTLKVGKKAKKEVSCLDLMGKWVGQFQGPRDLSTNKRHLKQAVLADDERQRKDRR
jgi:hypothetical protein